MKKLLFIAMFVGFAFHANAYHWTPNSGPYANTMTVVGVINIDGVEQTTTTLELGAFCGQECRGREVLMYASQLNRYLLYLNLFGNDGDVLTFRLYDESIGAERVLDCSNTITFVSNGTLGTLGSPYVFAFTTPSYSISASANPSAGGTVSGAGTYSHGATCTLTATANTGYNFTNWTKNGSVVSSNASYIFTVTEAGTYVANFTPISYTISASANPTAGGTVSGAGSYDYGTTCMLTATANTGYTFTNWTKNGTVVSSNANYSFTVTGAGTYVANFTLNSYSITVSASPAAGGTVTGGGAYSHGSTCTLTATANTGYTFTNWTKNGTVVSSNANYSFTVTGAGTYIANFTPISYTISVSANPTAGGTVSGAGPYNYGSTCTLTATANTGYTFTNWTKNGSVVSSNASYSFTVTEAGTYVANFSLNSYEITVAANPTAGGTATGAGTYNHGQTANLTATANTGYTFTNWTKNGTVVSSNANYSFTVTSGGNYVANFSLNSYAITATANPTAGGTISGTGNYDHGVTATLTATANTGYSFVRWTRDGTEVSTNASYSFTVTEAAAFVAHFSPNSYDIVVSASPLDGGTVSGGGSYEFGTTATVTATANTGYNFVNWTENGTQVSANASYSFTVSGDRTLVANFSTQSYVITASADPEAGGVITGSGGYDYGETCTLTATANTGYNFTRWTMNGSQVSTNLTYSFTVTQSATYVAHFSPNSYDIVVSASPLDGGTVSGGGSYEFGTTATVTATANTGYDFVNWTENGTQVSANASYSFTVSGDRTLVANFSTQSYVVTASADPEEGGVVTGSGGYDYGETCTLTATANTGYNFTRWTMNGSQVSTNLTYSFTVTQSATYVAHFSPNSYNIIVSANPSDGGTVSGDGSYEYGTTATVTASANTGYDFVNWTENGTQVSANASYSFTVSGDRTLVANFSTQSYVVTASADPEEGGVVTGSGGYDYGETCTLTATANMGYTFTNWTKDGTVVSEEPTYSFVVTESCELVAHLSFDNDIADNNASALLVYPNPVQDRVSISGVAMQTVMVYNTIGQLVITKECKNEDNLELDFGGLSSGVYTVLVRMTNGAVVKSVVAKK